MTLCVMYWLLLAVLLAAQTEGDMGYDYEDAYADIDEGNDVT